MVLNTDSYFPINPSFVVQRNKISALALWNQLPSECGFDNGGSYDSIADEPTVFSSGLVSSAVALETDVDI